MGFAKAQLMKEQERGWSGPSGDRAVCDACFNDPAVKQFVAAEATERACDYCGRTAAEPIAADSEKVMGLIMDSIATEWADPIEELGWDGAEGGYQGEMHEFWDVLEIVGNPIETVEFQEDLESAVYDYTPNWCKRDYGAPHLDEGLMYDWDHFVEQVQHEARFLFLLDGQDPLTADPGASTTVLQLLDRITRLAEISGLLVELPAGHPIWRARPRKWWKRPHRRAADLGTARSNTQSNRMSPAGIPAFYGAADLDLAVAEIRASRGRTGWSAGLFKTTAPCTVLDLSSLPDPPSLFDEERRHLRRPLLFLERFTKEISRSIKLDGREHVEYVPTQVVAEYLRVGFQPVGHERPVGLLYPSAQREDGVCAALFLGHERCVETDPGDGLALVLEESRHDRLWP